MAMQFNLPPAGTTLNANTALENLRLGYMVDRFSGAAINRTIAGQSGAVDTVFGSTGTDSDQPIINLTGARTVPTVGSWHISDRVIHMNGNDASLLVQGTGIHISFYNCTFIVTRYANDVNNGDWNFAFGITGSAGNGGANARGASARVDPTTFGGGRASTRSINFYGCTVTVVTEDRRGEMRLQFADAIGSDFRFIGDNATSGNLNIFPSPQRGGRWINSTFVTGQQRTGLSWIFTYGFPDVYEGVELYGLGIDNGVEDTSSGPRMLIEPNFSSLTQTTSYITQGVARQGGFTAQAQITQSVGFFTPPDNDDNTDGDVISFRGAGYVDIQNGGGGVINYAAYQPTYTDAILGTGIQNVRVRVNSSIGVNSPTVPTSATSFPNKLLRPGDTQTIGASFIGNEYVTNTNGMLTTSRYTLDGWTTPQDGYFDPMIFHSRSPQNSNILASNDLVDPSLDPPLNTAIAVIQDIRGTGAADLTFTRHEAQYEAFSWSHDILQELSEDSTTLFDDSTRATQTSYGINREVGIAAPSVIGTFVKDGFTASDNTPNLTALQGLFDQDDVPSINDIRMAYRYERYQFNVDGNPQTSLLDIVVDNDQSEHWSINTSNNIDIISIRGAGLTAKSDDLYTSDANISTLDMNRNPISGLTLGSRSVANAEGITLFEELRHSDTLPAASNSTLIGEYIVQPAGSTVDITFDNCNLSQLDLLPTAGTTVNVRGTDQNGVALSASSFMSTGTLGTVNFPAPVVTRTIETPDEPGYFGVRNVTQNSVVKLDGTPVGENAITTGNGNPGSFEIPQGSTDTYRFYWKRANDSTAGYSTTIIERSNVGLAMSMTETMSATQLIATLYSGDSRLGKANVADPSSSSRAAGNNGMQILVNNNILTNGAESQYHILSAMDWVQYIDVLTENNLTSDLINPDTVSSTVSDAAYIQFNTATAGEQQQLVGAQFTNVNGIDNMLYDRESFANTNFIFVDNLNTLTGEDRFFIRDRIDNSLLPATGNSARWPGITGSAIQILDADLVAVDVDDNSALATFLQALETRGFELADVRGQIQPRDSGGIQRADFNFHGITRTRTDTGTEYTFTLTAVNRPNTSTAILDTIGFASGTRGTMLGGNTLTGAQSDQVVQITGTGFSFPSVTLFPNPAGATPAQIQQAAETAINSSTAIATTRNGVGYMIGQGGDSRLIGIKPRATNYNSTDDYTGNL